MKSNSAVRHRDTNLRIGADGTRARPVYLDCCATTPLIPAVLEEIRHYLEIDYGNEGSRTHEYGTLARRRVNQAREEIALLAAADADEVIFTSGATEANNLAILGLADHLEQTGRRHIVTSALEHKAVLEPIALLEARGFEVTRLRADESGAIDPDEFIDAVDDQTGMVSLMHVNNETGVIQPLQAIAERLPPRVFFHVDAAQGFGKEFDEITNGRIDLISASAHKLHGPKGVGSLITRRRHYRRPPITPLMVGGGQQRGLRPGTLPVHLIAGYGAAASAALAERRQRAEQNRRFRATVLEGLRPLEPLVNGDGERSLPQVLNVSFARIDGEAAIVAIKDLVAVSNGSACNSGAYERSHVLEAMGLPPDRVASALRISWSHVTPEPDWVAVVERLAALGD